VADLRQFLTEHRESVWELPGDVSLVHELTALQHLLDERHQYPILHAKQVRNLAGDRGDVSIVTNLTASRELTARALGIPDHRRTAQIPAPRSGSRRAPKRVSLL